MKRPPRCHGLARSLMLVLCGVHCACRSGPTTQPSPRYYPALPEHPRIQFLLSLNSAEDVLPPQNFLERFLLGPRQVGAAGVLVRPYGMALWQGKLYVCDQGAKKVAVFDFRKGEFHDIRGEGGYQFELPVNIHVSPRGEKYVTDTVRRQVVMLDADDKPIRALRFRTGPGMKPCDAVWYENELFVADLKGNCIQVLDPKTGRRLRKLGTGGSAEGQFVQPTNLAIGPKGYLYVSDMFNARVQKMDRQGRFVRAFGGVGRALGKMVHPKGIAVDRAGRLYVAAAATDSVQIYNEKGRLLLMLGGAGAGRGDMSLPAKVVLSYDGIEHFAKYASPDFRIEYLIFVSNHLGPNKINVYGFGTYRGVLPEEGDRLSGR